MSNDGSTYNFDVNAAMLKLETAERELEITESRLQPSSRYRPKLFIDGDQWCALYGDNLQTGVAGFGTSPELAYADFDKQWIAALPESSNG
jgi:hypothetical protein